MDAIIQDMLSGLGYTQVWLESGILTEDILSEQNTQLNIGEDKNTEHYRYRVLATYIKLQCFFDNKKLLYILQILQNDGDKSMALSSALLLLKSKALTDSQFETVADFLRTAFGDYTTPHIEKAKTNRT